MNRNDKKRFEESKPAIGQHCCYCIIFM